jgi:hypothetical protein
MRAWLESAFCALVVLLSWAVMGFAGFLVITHLGWTTYLAITGALVFLLLTMLFRCMRKEF